MRHWVFNFILLFALLIASRAALAAPVTVDMSTSGQATASSSQRKTFFDSLNEVHWAFYYNGAAIEYSYSADGTTWTSAGTLPYNTTSFSAIYKTIAGTSYVFVVAEANTYDIVLRRGELNATSINFDAEQIVFDGTSVSDRYKRPTVAISENNHLWVSAIRDFGLGKIERFHVAVRRTNNNADGNISAFTAEMGLGEKIAKLEEAVIMPQKGDNMYLVSSIGENTISGYTFNESSWSAANTGGDYSWLTVGAGGLAARAIAISGGNIYVVGSFQNAGGDPNANFIAQWNSVDGTWEALGTGLNGEALAIAVSGADMYVGGFFTAAGGVADTARIARWSMVDNTWHPVGTGLDNNVYAIAISGADIYVGGSFTDAGGVATADRIARWNGTAWNALGNGIATGNVAAIAISGANVYVGGSFTGAGGVANTARIARWTGAAWSAMGTGISTSMVSAIAISGSDVYVGGGFTGAGGVANTARIARWTGAAWSAVGTGIANGAVNAIAISGSDVYLGGTFTDAGGNADADRIVRRNTSNNTWNALSSGQDGSVSAIVVSGSDVYLGGSFTNGITRRDTNTNTWNSFDSGGISWGIQAIAVAGTNVYFGGRFQNAAGIPEADHIVRWDGNSWFALGTGIAAGGSSGVNAIKISGTNVYVAGLFTSAGGVANTNNIARWDTSNNTWNSLDTGLNNYVFALAVSGNDVYAGGYFTDAGGVAAADNVAKWDGAAWNSLGSMPPNSGIIGMAISGTDLYIGGSFTEAGGVANTRYVARWDGAAWNALANGVSSYVDAIAVSGSDVYVGGYFTNAGGSGNADRIAKWNGSNWSALGSGISDGSVHAITVVGSDVYVGGNFSIAGGVAGTAGVARWSNSNNAWNSLGAGVDEFSYGIRAIGAFDSKIFIGGGDYPLFVNDANQFTYLAYYTPTIATDSNTSTEISATSDNDGNVYLIYTNEDDEVKFRRFDESDAEWGAMVTLNATTSSSPSITYKNSNGRVLASWIESNAVSYRHAVSPYAAADWKAETTFYNTGINAAVTAVGNQETDDLQFVWTNGAANPYNIYTDRIDMSTVPTVAVTSTATSPTNTSPIPVTVQFGEAVTGFVVGDITVGNGTAGNFVVVDGDTYTVEITPTADGVVTVDVAAGVAEDSFDNDNLAATQFAITYDATAPTVLLSSTVTDPTNASPFSVTVQFSEVVTGFVVGDVAVGNGSAGNFVAVDGDTYTVDITPTADGAVTVDVASGVAEDAAGNDNTAAVQLTRVYDNTIPTVSIASPAGPITLANSASFALSGSCSENSRAVSLTALSSGGGSGVAGSPNCAAGAWSTSLNLSGLNDGVVTITADHEDAVGLDAVQATRTVNKETSAPSVVISSNLTSPTQATTIPITILFSEVVTGFAQADIAVTNATLSGFAAVSGQQYQATLTPTAAGAVTASIGSGVAQDSVGNSNTAAAQFLITYEVEEAEIETDAVCSVWNSFFNKEDGAVWNILEHVNTGSTDLAIETTLYSRDGVAQSSAQFVISSGQRQLDLLVHEMAGWAANSYGLVCSKVTKGSSNDLDGRMVYYRQKRLGGFEYVFASPFSRGSLGQQFVGFNTFQPSLNAQDSNHFVANWIQITNLENDAQTGQLRFYSQSGELLKSEAVTVPGIGQSDISAHNWDRPMVGLVQWQPTNQTARFIVRNSRYFYDNAEMQEHFTGVVQMQASEGSKEMLSAIVDTEQASSILELSNVTTGEVQSKVKFYNSEGDLLAELDLTLPELGTQHVIADAILQQGLGSVTVVVPEAKEKSLIATVLQYGREPSGSIGVLYGVAGLKSVSDVLRSSYNTFLNQGCELYLFNQSSEEEQTATISMQRQNGTQVFGNSTLTLRPLQSVVSNICAAEAEESYGMVTVTTNPGAAFHPFLLRRDDVGRSRYPIPVR